MTAIEYAASKGWTSRIVRIVNDKTTERFNGQRYVRESEATFVLRPLAGKRHTEVVNAIYATVAGGRFAF